MQQALRPYATAGLALVGASMIAVTPVAAPPAAVSVRPVQLVDAWSDLFTNTADNWQNIINNADSQAISEVFSAFLTNPSGVIGAFANLTPTVTTDVTSLPAQISVEFSPGLEYAIAQMAAVGATLTALQSVASDLGNPESWATVLNGYLNGQDDISLLNGSITIPLWNGILAPIQTAGVHLSLTNLIDALGLGNTPLTNLDLTSLLDQLGLGQLTLGGLFSDLGLANKGLGDLLGDPSIGTLLTDLGVGKLGLGTISLTTLLSDLGLNSSMSNLGLGSLLDELGVGSLKLGSLLDLNSILGGIPGIGALLTPVINALTNIPLDQIVQGVNLGSGFDLTTLVTDAFKAANLPIPTIDLTLNGLLTDLNLDNLSVGSLLNTVSLGTLLGDLGLSNLPLNLTNLGDISGLTLGGLLGDLGLGDLANVTLSPFGGMVTELVDVMPQQILAALGM